MTNYRQAARGAPCTNCGAPDAVLAHYSGLRQHDFGKGRSRKGDDFYAAPQCTECHADGPFSEGHIDPASVAARVLDSPPGVRRYMIKLEKSEEQLLQILKWHKSLEEQE